MSTFDDREKGQEAKFAHDADLRFRAEARRNKLIGLWAAGLIGHKDPAAYAQEVVASDFAEAGEEDVYRKLAMDIGSKASEAEIRAKMGELMGVAQQQILTEG